MNKKVNWIHPPRVIWLPSVSGSHTRHLAARRLVVRAHFIKTSTSCKAHVSNGSHFTTGTKYHANFRPMPPYSKHQSLTQCWLNIDATLVQCLVFARWGINPYNADIFLYKPQRPKGFSIWNHHICPIVSFFLFIWIPILWVYSHYK